MRVGANFACDFFLEKSRSSDLRILGPMSLARLYLKSYTDTGVILQASFEVCFSHVLKSPNSTCPSGLYSCGFMNQNGRTGTDLFAKLIFLSSKASFKLQRKRHSQLLEQPNFSVSKQRPLVRCLSVFVMFEIFQPWTSQPTGWWRI